MRSTDASEGTRGQTVVIADTDGEGYLFRRFHNTREAVKYCINCRHKYKSIKVMNGDTVCPVNDFDCPLFKSWYEERMKYGYLVGKEHVSADHIVAVMDREIERSKKDQETSTFIQWLEKLKEELIS